MTKHIDTNKMSTNQKSTEVSNLESLTSQIEKAKAELKALNEQKKAITAKTPRQLKGRPCEFLNKAGQKISGMGTEYIVVTFEKKLHYKAKDQVKFLD